MLSVVRRIGEIYDVDYTKPSVQQRHMIVDDLSAALLNKDVGVPEIGGSLPNPRDHFRGPLKRYQLIWNAEVLVSDHVPENPIERLVVRRREMLREILGADEDIDLRRAKRPVVLAVGEEEIHTNGWLRLLEDVAQSDEHPDAGSAVVGAGHRHFSLRFRGGGLGDGARIPVGDIENPFLQLGPEPGENVPQLKLLSVGRRVGEALNDQ